MEQSRDPQLWEEAKKRAGFKSHLLSYVIVNIFLWVLWFITQGRFHKGGIPWPLYSTVGWGIGLLFHFLGVYVFDKVNLVEREYEKLKNKK